MKNSDVIAKKQTIIETFPRNLPALVVVEDKQLVPEWLLDVRNSGSRMNSVGIHQGNASQILARGVQNRTVYVTTLSFILTYDFDFSLFRSVVLEVNLSVQKSFDVLRQQALDKLSVVQINPATFSLLDYDWQSEVSSHKQGKRIDEKKQIEVARKKATEEARQQKQKPKDKPSQEVTEISEQSVEIIENTSEQEETEVVVKVKKKTTKKKPVVGGEEGVACG